MYKANTFEFKHFDTGVFLDYKGKTPGERIEEVLKKNRVCRYETMFHF